MKIGKHARAALGWTALALAAAMAGAGCTRHVSRDVSPEGTAGEVVFPARERIVLEEGTFPNRESLRQIGPGATKDQLYHLIGRPHFREGFAAREWDYLFHFREGDRIVTCQYKVIFDRQYRGRSFHWSPAECAGLLQGGDEAAGGQSAAGAAKRFEVSTDALFAFDRSDVADILPHGREEIARIAAQIRGGTGQYRTRVIGHTDGIGDAAYNLALSQRRAETVRRLLIDDGVPAERITAEGRGEAEPLKRCDPSLPRAALIDCLQPNRRVVIATDGVR